MLARNHDSLLSLAAWLRTKDPDEEYIFVNNLGCMFFQYYTAMGLPVASVGPRHITLEDGTIIPLPKEFCLVALPGTKRMAPWVGHWDLTAYCRFGDALAECERLIKEQANAS